jgi:hypothetical protein
MNVEEAYRTFADEKNNGYLVLLDAKAAFDKVVHSHLFRRIYQAGIQNKTWSLISNLHQEAKSCIKWKSSNSEMFDVKMGVRRGGIISADLYKLYINPLLDHHLQNVNVGHRIGNIKNNNTGCADDVALISQDIQSRAKSIRGKWRTSRLSCLTLAILNLGKSKIS